MAFTRDWLSSWILDHSKFKTQPSYVRGLMDDVGERLAAYLYGFSTGETFTGYKKVTLVTIGTGDGSIPTGTGVQEAIQLQGKTIDGKVELITIDADGNEIQFTSKGNALANDKWLTATDAAGTGGVNILKVNTGGAVEFSAVFLTGLSALYPVGCIYTTTVATNPASVFGFGTWEAFGEGRVLVGKAAAGTFATAGGTGGESTHVLITEELADHTHTIDTTKRGGYASNNEFYTVATGGGSPATVTSSSVGSGTAHNNLQPYIVVYFFKRTA